MDQPAKRKVSVTVDADLVDDIKAAGENLSARINDALREEVRKQRRRQKLREFLNYLDETDGPLNTPADEADMQRFMRLLGWDGDPKYLPEGIEVIPPEVLYTKAQGRAAS